MRKFRYLKKFENFKDLDDVLDKISKKGYVSLNDKEKEYIENWNEKAKLDRNIDVLENTSFIIEIKDIDEEVDFYNFNVVLRYKKDNKKYKGNIVIDKLNPINFDYYLKDNTGNDIDISPIDFYELDSLIQSMVEKNINENFIPINESNKNNYDILSQNFVKEKNNKYYIWNIMENKWVTLSFSNLLRFLLFSYITQYNKDDEILLQIKNDVNNENYTNLVKYYDMLASNNTFYRKNIKDILNVDMSGKNLNKIYDLDIIEKMWLKKDELFKSEILANEIKKQIRINSKTEMSENYVIELINKGYLFDDKYNAEHSSIEEDKKGIDLLLIPKELKYGKKDERLKGQVKMTLGKSKSEYRINKIENSEKIIIYDSNISIGDVNKKVVDYLFLFLSDKQKIVSINTKDIINIERKDNSWIINLIKGTSKRLEVIDVKKHKTVYN